MIYLIMLVAFILWIIEVKYKPRVEFIESGIIFWYTDSYHHDMTPHRLYKYIIQY